MNKPRVIHTNAGNWEKLSDNVSFKHLARDEARNFQMDITTLAPNSTLKEHTHADVEWIFVLEGSFYDDNGTYSVGDFMEFPKNSTHISRSGEAGCKLLRYWCGKVIGGY